MDRPLAIVNRFYATTDRHDADGLAQLVSEDMRFVGPLMSTESAAAYIDVNREFLPLHAATRMQRQLVDGDCVCSIYEMDVVTPAGGTLTLEVADVLTVTDGRISSQHLYYDPREFAAALGM